MRNQRISLHLSEPNTSRAFPTFNGLLCDAVDGTGCSDLVFVENHVSETLVVDYAEVDVGGEFLAGYA